MLHFTENNIHQSGTGFDKTWAIPDLLETHDPLPGETLAERNAAMKKAVEMAEETFPELSENARLRYDFWKLFLPKRVSEQRFEYATKVTHTYHWELTVNELGIFYKDGSGEYDGRQGWVSEQLFSDFWFYGPLLPIPDLNIRKTLVATIRNAFLQAGSPASYKHFELFEYPKAPDIGLHWVVGDEKASDFVTVRDYGIEIGASNWHDGLAYLGFLSFENFLTLPPREGSNITPEIRAEIEKHLAQRFIKMKAENRTVAAGNADNSHVAEGNAGSKRLFMDNGGRSHYIYLDDDGHKYRASPAEEAMWRAELIEFYTRRLAEEDHEAILEHLAIGLKYNGVQNVGELLLEAAKKAGPKVRQSLAKVLFEKFDPERGAETYLLLLEYEAETDYWRNYVFNSLFNMRDVRTAQDFILQKLRGDNEIHFKKAVDVLRMWGIKGDEALSDRDLLNALNWPEATANDPNFRAALEKTIKIIHKQ